MREVRLSETEQMVFELLKQGYQGIDEVKQAMEKKAGHPYCRGLVVNILVRLRRMRIGVRQELGDSKTNYRRRYVVAA